eukprot:1876963-Amphidinium_carterae.2
MFYDSLHEMYTSESAWSIMSERCLTLKCRALGFQLLSRLGGVVKLMISWPHSRFPSRVFGVLQNVMCAAEISAAPPCMKDNLTLKLEQQFGSVADKRALACLELVASQQSLDISCIESRHASTRRQVLIRSCQTWVSALTQISAEWLLQNFRRADSGKVHKKIVAKVRQKRQRKQTHAGGSWRAFVRLRASRMIGKPDLYGLAMEYKTLKDSGDPIIHQCFSLGSSMQKVSKMCAKAGTNHKKFLVSARQLEVATEREHTNEIDMAFAACSVHGTPQEFIYQKRFARAITSMQAARERQTLAEHTKILLEYEEKLGSTRLAELHRYFPALSSAALKPIPHPSMLVFQAKDEKIKEVGTHFCAWAIGNQTTDAGAALERWWDCLHETKQEPHAIDVDEEAQTLLDMKLCQEVGFCVCNAPGRRLQAARNQLLKIMKAVHKSQSRRASLGSGQVVLQLLVPNTKDDDVAVVEASGIAQELFLHVSTVNWSPYRPVFQALQRVDAHVFDVELLGCIFVKVAVPNTPSRTQANQHI